MGPSPRYPHCAHYFSGICKYRDLRQDQGLIRPINYDPSIGYDGDGADEGLDPVAYRFR